jgi:tetratricopeptide (TPR) repeat protein
MARRYFNWKLAIVLVLGLSLLSITAFGLRRWQKTKRADQSLVLGNQAYTEHKWQDAAVHLGRYLAVSQDNVPILLKYADAQLKIRPLKSGNLQQAVTAYRAALRADKDNSEAALRLTEIYLQGAPGEAEFIAIKQIGDSNDLQPGTGKVNRAKAKQRPELWRMYAVALASQRKFDDSKEQLKNLMEDCPGYVLAYDTLGQLTERYTDRFDPNRDQKPGYWFDEAVHRNPSSALAHICRAAFYLRQQQRARGADNRLAARTDLDEAQKLDLSDIDVRLRLARELINADALDAAEKQLAAIRQAEPANQPLWQVWAQLALKSQNIQKMTEIAEAGLKELLAQPWDFMPLAAELFIGAGQYDKAENCVNQLGQNEIAPAKTAFLEGLLAYQKGNLRAALDSWRRAVQSGDKSQQIQLLLSSVLSRLGDSQTAMQQLRLLVSENPNLFEARLRLARMLAQNGSWDEAAEQARMAAQISPSLDAALLYNQARMQLAGTDRSLWDDIEKSLATIEKAAVDSVDVKLTRFQFLMQRQKFADAETLLSQIKQLRPSGLNVALAEAELLLARNKRDQAISLLNKAIEEFPHEIAPVRYLAALYTNNGDYTKSVETINAALARIRSSQAKPELGLLLADVYDRSKEGEKAYRCIESLAKECPNDIPLKRRLLTCLQVVRDLQKAQSIVDDIKKIETDQGWQWRYEQARLWFQSEDYNDFKARCPQIVAVLNENLLANPYDQAGRLLLASTYARWGEQTRPRAIAAYLEAFNRSPRDIRIILAAVQGLYRLNDYRDADDILGRAAKDMLYNPDLQKLEFRRRMRFGDIDSADNSLEQMLVRDPNDRSVCFMLAWLKMQQGDFQGADALLGRLKVQEPNSLDIAAVQVELDVRQGKSKEALSRCDRIIKDHNDASSYLVRARTYAAVGNTGKALEDYQHAEAMEPNNASVFADRSDFHRSLGRIDEANADIDRALSLAPGNQAVQKRAVSLYLTSARRDRRDQAKAMLDKLLQANPRDVQLRLIRANVLFQDQTLPAMEEATKIVREITEERPGEVEAWVMWGEIMLRQNQPKEASYIASQGLAVKPNDRRLLLLKARSEAVTSPPLAIPILKSLYERDPNDLETVIFLAQTYVSANEPEKAVSLLKTRLDSPGLTITDQRRLSLMLAVSLHKDGQKEASQAELDRLYKSEPNDPAPLYAEVDLLGQENLWDELNRKVTGWYRVHPQDSNIPAAIATRLAGVNSAEARRVAETLLRDVLERDRNSLSAMTTLAMLLQVTDRPADAAELYERIIARQPENVMAMNNLAWILCRQNQLEKSLKLAQRGLELAPKYVDLIDTRGVIYLRLEQFEKAAEDFKRCLDLYPKRSRGCVATQFHLGQALERLGQKVNALSSLNKALELNAEIGGLSAADKALAEQLIKQLEGA